MRALSILPGKLLTLLASLALCGAAAAQSYPDKPIRLVLGFAAGGPTDIIARHIAKDLSDIFKQSVVVENKTGASGNIATDFVGGSAADGYTLLFTAHTHLTNEILMDKLRYNPIRDFAPISEVCILPLLLLTEAASLPLSDIVADINKFSNNVMAQQLFLSLSSQAGQPARFDASKQMLLQWWQAQLPDQPAPILENGSGLSRHERSSAAALTRLLQLAASGPHAQVFQNSLGLAGVDGTVERLKDRNPNAAAIGQAWLKTGSLRDVISLAGYVQGYSGQRYTLVAIVNHANANAARPALDHLLEWTVHDQQDAGRAPARILRAK